MFEALDSANHRLVRETALDIPVDWKAYLGVSRLQRSVVMTTGYGFRLLWGLLDVEPRRPLNVAGAMVQRATMVAG